MARDTRQRPHEADARLITGNFCCANVFAKASAGSLGVSTRLGEREGGKRLLDNRQAALGESKTNLVQHNARVGPSNVLE
jgi:hypothetical protein